LTSPTLPQISFLIPELPQNILAPGAAGVAFHALGGQAVHHPQDAPSQFGLGQDGLHGVGGGAEDPADLRAEFDRIEHVDGKGVFQEDVEGVARAQQELVFRGRGLKVRIVALHPDEAIPGGLGKCQPELNAGHGPHQDFKEVFHGFDKMALAQNEIGPFGDGEFYQLQFHGHTSLLGPEFLPGALFFCYYNYDMDGGQALKRFRGTKAKRRTGEDPARAFSLSALSPCHLFPPFLKSLALLAAVWLLWAAPAAAAIKIGLYFPMTGSAAAMGQMVWEGVQVAHKLQPQVLGQPVRLVLVDTRSDRIEAANAVSRLIEKDRVAAIIGEVISSDTLAGVPIAERAGIPNISPTATSPLVTQNRKYAFRACFVDSVQGRVAARFAYENLKARRVAVLIDQAQDYCVGLAKFFMDEFKRRGGQVVSVSYIQTGDQDFSAQISALKETHPDLIYAPNYYAEDALLAKQLKDLGVNTPVLTGDGAQVPELLSIGGAAVNGMYFTAHFHRRGINTELGRKFMQAYESTYKKPLDAFAALGADAYFLLTAAINQAGVTNGAQVAQALAATRNFPGVTGIIAMGPNHNPIKGVTIIKVENGKFVYQTTINP